MKSIFCGSCKVHWFRLDENHEKIASNEHTDCTIFCSEMASANDLAACTISYSSSCTNKYTAMWVACIRRRSLIHHDATNFAIVAINEDAHIHLRTYRMMIEYMCCWLPWIWQMVALSRHEHMHSMISFALIAYSIQTEKDIVKSETRHTLSIPL